MPSPPRKLTLLAINVDVLAIIVSYLSPTDAIAFSRTCQAIQAVPLDPALHTVVLNRTPEQIEKFRDHLLAVPSRQNMLKCLTLTKAVTWEIDIHASAPANAIADVIEGAKNLQLFSCGAMEDMIRASDGHIANALTSRTNLRVLDLREGGAKVVGILSDLQSPHLGELVLDLTFMSKLPWNSLFQPLAKYHHLETLSISKAVGRILFPFTFLPDFAPAGVPAFPIPSNIAPFNPQTTPVMPSVRTLSFLNTFVPMPLAAMMFPNVTTLTFRTDRLFRGFFVPEGGLQHEFGSPLPCWQHALAEAHLDVVDCAIWPLACHVRWLDFDFLPGGYGEEALDAVAHTTPEVLSVAYRIDTDNIFWVRLPAIANNLRFLDVRILELSGHRKIYVLLHLSRFPALKALFLCMRAFYQPDDHDAEAAAMARELAQRNRQLRVVGIALTDGRSMRDDEPVWPEELLGSRWWKVERDEDWLHEVQSMEAIPTEAGLKVRDYMYAADFDSADWEERLEMLV